MRARTFWAVVIAIILVLIAAWAIDVDTSGELKMPEIRADVDVRGGELPKVDVETADIEVREKRATVNLPDIDVEMKEREIPYPDIEIRGPEENTTAEEDDLNRNE